MRWNGEQMQLCCYTVIVNDQLAIFTVQWSIVCDGT